MASFSASTPTPVSTETFSSSALSSSSSSGEMMMLISCDGENIAANMTMMGTLSSFIGPMIECRMDSDESEPLEVVIPNVKAETLRRVVAFCDYFTVTEMTPIAKPLVSGRMSDLVQPWYVEFVEGPQDKLIDLIMAANFLDIRPLFELVCAYTASLVKDKTPAEIVETFGLEAELTAEEEFALRSDPANAWADEDIV